MAGSSLLFVIVLVGFHLPSAACPWPARPACASGCQALFAASPDPPQLGLLHGKLIVQRGQAPPRPCTMPRSSSRSRRLSSSCYCSPGIALAAFLAQPRRAGQHPLGAHVHVGELDPVIGQHELPDLVGMGACLVA